MSDRVLLLTVFAGLAALSLRPTAAAAEPEWPQYRGAARDGISQEIGPLSNLNENGPHQLWKAEIGTGFSSVVIANGLAYASGNSNDTDTIFCFDALTGKEVWRHSYPCMLGSGQFEGGPTATPTISGPAVYTLSREGQVFCLEAKTGKPIWGKNIAEEVQAKKPSKGFAGSGFVIGNQVIFNIGVGGVSVDKTSGQVLWKGRSGFAGYAPPVPFTVGGSTLLLLFSGDALVAVNPITGTPAWEYPWKTTFNVNAADPVVIGKSVFISSGYNHGCALLDASDGAPKVVWESKAMRNTFSSSLYFAGHIYGFDDNILKCLDAGTGAADWEQRGFGKGALILADGKLVILSDKGELAIAEASPAAYHELSRSQVLGGRCWTAPSLCAGKLYCRNAQGDLVCLALK